MSSKKENLPLKEYKYSISDINSKYKKILTNCIKECIDSGVDSIYSSYCMQYGVMEIKDFTNLIEGIGLLDFLLVCNFVINMSESEFEYKRIPETQELYIDFDGRKMNPEVFTSAFSFIAQTKYHWIPTNAPKKYTKQYQNIFTIAMHCEKLLFDQHVVDGDIDEFRN